ncbi:MAG: hypothetical protein DSM106950_11760 [Stigonema ocellatum SAG 48.90 = DSM 106950]|nr:hypothetical protein [Stigonema ocellatum SAG 48.90 = DSM 106950]
MTQSFAGQTPIPDNTWRRHTDPPSLWIAVATGSVVLHFLLFWLMRLSGFSLLSQQQKNAPIPIEYMEFSPKAQSKAKPHSKAKSVLPNPPSTTQRLRSTSLPKQVSQQNFTAKSPSTSKDSYTFAFPHTKQITISQRETQVLPKKPPKKLTAVQKTPPSKTKPKLILKPESTFSPEIADNIEPNLTQSPETRENLSPQPTPSPKIPHNRRIKRAIAQSPKTSVLKNLQPTPPPQTPVHRGTNTWGQQDLLASGQPKQPLLPSPNVTDPTTSPSSPNSSPVIGQQLEPPPSPQPSLPSRLPRQPGSHINPGKGTPLSQNGGGIALATLEVKSDELKRDVPDNPAKPKISTIPWRCPALNTESNSQAKDFRVDFWIDNNQGKVTNLTVYPQDVPVAQRSQYQKCADEMFKGVEFTQATTKGKASPTTEQVLRIKIERR